MENEINVILETKQIIDACGNHVNILLGQNVYLLVDTGDFCSVLLFYEHKKYVIQNNLLDEIKNITGFEFRKIKRNNWI